MTLEKKTNPPRRRPQAADASQSRATRLRVLVLVQLNWYGSNIIRGIQQYKHQATSFSFVLDAQELMPGPGQLDRILNWQGDGIIAHIRDENLADTMRRVQVPVVNVAGVPFGMDLPSVVEDDAAVGRVGAEDLLGRSLCHFASYGCQGMVHMEQRACAFKQAVEQAGFSCRQYMLPKLPTTNGQWEQYQRSLVRWLQSLPKPVGVLACNDHFGWQVLEAARQAELDVPQEIAVLGVGDNDVLCRMTAPPLSSIALRPQSMGYEAAALLDRLMAGKALPDSLVRIAPGGISTRQSSSILAIEDPCVLAAVRFIREHAETIIQVDDVLHHVTVSRRSLERRFQAVLGHSPYVEIQRTHLERAMRLLRETDASIASIAAAAGFPNASRFAAIFREHAGTTPLQYRKLHKLR